MDVGALLVDTVGGTALRGGRCGACDAVSFPARRVCDRCFVREIESELLPARGHARSAATVARPPEGFTQPIRIGVVELDSGPSFFAAFADDVCTGVRVRAVHGLVRAGQQGFRFESDEGRP